MMPISRPLIGQAAARFARAISGRKTTAGAARRLFLHAVELRQD